MFVDAECADCGKLFPSGARALFQHCDATGHDAILHSCRDPYCSDDFVHESARDQHEHDDHVLCGDCDRQFMNQNNLNQHLNSRVHRGADMLCPFCSREFVSATGLTHHLEGGGCKNASLNRDRVYQLVRQRDPKGVISKKLIGYHGATTYLADDKSWNGYDYECYLCHRAFRQLTGLNQHLASSIHQQVLYHCPNRRCPSEFKSLAGIMNHLESESCQFMRFEAVQTQMNNLVRSDRRLTF